MISAITQLISSLDDKSLSSMLSPWIHAKDECKRDQKYEIKDIFIDSWLTEIDGLSSHMTESFYLLDGKSTLQKTLPKEDMKDTNL